jgi:hypothetical protein
MVPVAMPMLAHGHRPPHHRDRGRVGGGVAEAMTGEGLLGRVGAVPPAGAPPGADRVEREVGPAPSGVDQGTGRTVDRSPSVGRHGSYPLAGKGVGSPDSGLPTPDGLGEHAFERGLLGR